MDLLSRVKLSLFKVIGVLTLSIALLAGLLLAGRWYVQADPKLLLKVLKWLLISLVLFIALFFLISGRVGLALAALPALLPWFIRFRLLRRKVL